MKYNNLVDFKADDFNKEDLFDVSYDNQKVFFNVIKEEFTDLNQQEDALPVDVFVQQYGRKIVDIIEMAAGGIVPAQDYLCYMYKRGIEDLLESNLTRAHEWGIIAVSNGSKLSIERLRLFFEPVFDFIIDSNKVENIIEKNKLNDENISDFIAQNYCLLLIDEMKIELLNVAKKPIEQKENFIKFSHDATEANKKVLPRLLELIA